MFVSRQTLWVQPARPGGVQATSIQADTKASGLAGKQGAPLLIERAQAAAAVFSAMSLNHQARFWQERVKSETRAADRASRQTQLTDWSRSNPMTLGVVQERHQRVPRREDERGQHEQLQVLPQGQGAHGEGRVGFVVRVCFWEAVDAACCGPGERASAAL